MGSPKALVLTIALAAASSRVFAADRLPAPPPAPPPPPIEFGGWYLRGDVGVAVNRLTGFHSVQSFNSLGGQPPAEIVNFASLGDSALAGAGFGYRFNNWLRADVTSEYRTQAVFGDSETFFAFCPADFCSQIQSAGLATALFLADGYVDLGTWSDITPYLGAGVGVAHHWFSNLVDITVGEPGSAGGLATDKTETNLAWAVMAGLGYRITPRLALDFGYRYVDMGRVNANPVVCTLLSSCFFERKSFRVASHDIRLGFRYALGEFAAPAPAPLVRKY